MAKFEEYRTARTAAEPPSAEDSGQQPSHAAPDFVLQV